MVPLPQNHCLNIKGQATRFLLQVFFSRIIFHYALKITLRLFRSFSKITELFASQGAPPVQGQVPGGKFATRFIDTGGKFGTGAAGVLNTGGK
jgi:hypothetical protein